MNHSFLRLVLDKDEQALSGLLHHKLSLDKKGFEILVSFLGRLFLEFLRLDAVAIDVDSKRQLESMHLHLLDWFEGNCDIA